MPNVCKIIIALLFCTTPIMAEELCSLAMNALSQSEEIRGLEIKRAVNCKVQNKDEIEKYLRDTIDLKIPEEKIRKESKLFKSLGLLPKDYQYKEGLIKLYTSQVAGYYEPVSEYYVMAGWMPPLMQMPIAVHELTHAIQDQYYDLDKFLDPETLTSDQALARSAVVEGDATAVMYDYINQLSGKPPLAEQDNVQSIVFQAVTSSRMMPGFSEAPQGLQFMLLFPYTSGLHFSHYLLKNDGGYAGLNKVFNRIPLTTKEILHPEFYQKAIPFEALTINELRSFFAPSSLEVGYQDRIGEFLLSIIIKNEDATLAKSWMNDLAVIDKNTDLTYWLIDLGTKEQATKLLEIFKKINPEGLQDAIIKNNLLGLILK